MSGGRGACLQGPTFFSNQTLHNQSLPPWRRVGPSQETGAEAVCLGDFTFVVEAPPTATPGPGPLSPLGRTDGDAPAAPPAAATAASASPPGRQVGCCMGPLVSVTPALGAASAHLTRGGPCMHVRLYASMLVLRPGWAGAKGGCDGTHAAATGGAAAPRASDRCHLQALSWSRRASPPGKKKGTSTTLVTATLARAWLLGTLLSTRCLLLVWPPYLGPPHATLIYPAPPPTRRRLDTACTGLRRPISTQPPQGGKGGAAWILQA